MDLSAFRRRLTGQADSVQHRQQPTGVAASAHAPRDTTQETLLGLLAGYPDARREIAGIPLTQLFDSQYLPLAQALLEVAEQTPEMPPWPELLARLEQEEQKRLVARLLVQDQHLADIDWRTALRHCLKRQEQARSRELRQIAQRLATLPEDSDEYQELIKSAELLRNRKSAL